MTPRQMGRMHSRIEFERFCQSQQWDVTRALEEMSTRMIRTKRLGSVLRVDEIQDGLAHVEVRR